MKIKALIAITAILFSASSFASGLSMSCKVAPPGSNVWQSNCFTSIPGGPPSVTVTFRINNAPSNFQASWSDPGCVSTSLTCDRALNAPAIYGMSAVVTDLDTWTIYPDVSSTASYIN